MHSSSSVFFFLFSLLLLVQLSVGSKYYEVVDSAVSFSPDERGGVGTSCYLSNSQFRQCFGVTESGRRSGELSCNFEVSNGRSCAQEGKNGKSCQSSCANGECLPCPSPSSQEGHGEGEGEDSGSQTEGCPSCVSPCEGAVCDCGLTTCNPENATYCDPCGTMGQLACSTCMSYFLLFFLNFCFISFRESRSICFRFFKPIFLLLFLLSKDFSLSLTFFFFFLSPR